MKKTFVLSLNLLVGSLLIGLSSYIKAPQETEIRVTEIRSVKGKILLKVFKDQPSYEAEQPFQQLEFDKKTLVDGTLLINCKLEPGIYGFTLVDDENANGKIDKNLIGWPKEGFGFSEFFMQKLKKPVFNDFKVDLKTQRKITIKVKYM